MVGGLDSVICCSLWLHVTSIRAESVCSISNNCGGQMALKRRFANRSSYCSVRPLIEKSCCVDVVNVLP